MKRRVVIRRSGGYDPSKGREVHDPSLDSKPLKGASFRRADTPRPMALSPTQRRLLERARAATGGEVRLRGPAWMTAKSLAHRGLGRYTAPSWGVRSGSFVINDKGRAELESPLVPGGGPDGTGLVRYP